MLALADMFDRKLDFDPTLDFESFLKTVPAKWAVYLLAGEDDRPVQLLCVKNLRYSLERRLGTGEQTDAPTRRVNYREIIRRVHWRRVDSAFEADAVYLEAARAIFPQTYRGMTGFRPAWFVHVNPQTNFPRYTKTIDPTGRTGVYLGPIEDKHAAQKLVHLAESLFDLCRDYSILTQSPRAGPCAWKQMNKCVGPCDGSVSLEAYRALVAWSASVLSDPQDYVRDQTRRMQQAAGELHFELAEKIKSHIDQLAQLRKGPFRHVRPLDQFKFLSLQRGPRAGTAKVFLILPGLIEPVAAVVHEPAAGGELLRHVLALAEDRPRAAIDDEGTERIGVVAHHLFVAKHKQGVFIPLESVDEKSVKRAFVELLNQKPQEGFVGEGVTKELQAI